MSNLEVRKYVLGGNGSDTLPRRIKLCRLRWLGHVLRMEPHRLPHQALFSLPQTGLKMRPSRPTDDVAASKGEESYGWFKAEWDRLAFTWLGPKRYPHWVAVYVERYGNES